MEYLDEAVLRTDIKRTAGGFAYKKLLGKGIDEVKKSVDPGAKKKMKLHRLQWLTRKI